MLDFKIVNTSQVEACENKDSYTYKEVLLFIIEVNEEYVSIKV